MSKYIDKNADFNQKLIDDLIFNKETGFIHFVESEIIKSEERKSMPTPDDF
jgi:hypothetical protein